VVRRYEIDDREWALIHDVVPAGPGGGRPRREPRAMLSAMFWILRSGSPWRDLPERYGPWQTVFHRFNEWRRTGVIDRILKRLQLRLDENGYIDTEVWLVDGTIIRASKAAAGAGKRGAPGSRRITL
jgi:transposase